MMKNSNRLVIFAKAPIAGEVKTRMIPALGKDGATQLHIALMLYILEMAHGARELDVELCCAPDEKHPFFTVCEDRYGVELSTQGAGDLGERMYRCLARHLAYPVGTPYSSVCIVGADCPAVRSEHIRLATEALNHTDTVLIPADDGGYVLVGVRRLHPQMFAGINWGTAQVLNQQRDAFQRVGMTCTELPILWDVDIPEDLQRLEHLEPPLLLSNWIR